MSRRRFEPTITLTRIESDGHVGVARVFRRTSDKVTTKGRTALIGSDRTADLRISSAPAWLAEVTIADEMTALLSPAGDARALTLTTPGGGPRAVLTQMEVRPGTDLLIGVETWRLEWEI